jgi:hypothetical protein
MSSVVDICNVALARLGDSATVSSIDPPEGSMQAEHCAIFYPIARDSLLETHDWNFATSRWRLARITGTPPGRWSFSYSLPPDFIRAISVFSEDNEDAPVEYVIESGAVLTNAESVLIRYVRRENDTTRYSRLVIDALAWLLASYLAGPVMKGSDGAKMSQQCLQFYQVALSLAARSDAAQQNTPAYEGTSWIMARR